MQSWSRIRFVLAAVTTTTLAGAVLVATFDAQAAACPANGRITYTLNKSPTPNADQVDAYGRIQAAMKQALEVYNCQANFTKAVTVSYLPGIATADGNENGSLRFGANRSFMNQRTAMHEIAHTLGVGGGQWASHVLNGNWTGPNATAALRVSTNDPKAVLHADRQHFWPFGLNQDSEGTSPTDLMTHVKIVEQLRKDMAG